MYTTLIKNCTVYDGTEADPFKGSLLIEDENIQKIFKGNAGEVCADEVIDANGLVCTPGFIDIHRHADYALFDDGFGIHELSQGLTTIINGNCGMSGAPFRLPEDSSVAAYQEPIIGKIPDRVQTHSIKAYCESVKDRKPALNVGLLAGLGTIASTVNGVYGTYKKGNVSSIRTITENAIQDGARGVSLGIGYKPVFTYTTKEIIAGLEAIKNTDIPVTVHMRQEGTGMLEALSESIQIARELNVPFEISHLKAIGTANWRNAMPEALRMLRRAKEEGIRIGWDVYPYTAGSTQLIHVLPPEICGHEADILQSEDLYRQAKNRIEQGTDFENIIRLCGYDHIFPGHLYEERLASYNGLSLQEGADKAGTEPLRWLLTILSREKSSPSMLDFITCEEDIALALSDPETAIISDSIYPADGNYHPRVAGTFSRIIEKYVLRDKTISLKNAIRQMTALPAERMHIKDRGLLREHYKADICLFDLASVKERAEYGKPLVPSSGMERVFINGKTVLNKGKIVNLHAGQCI